jgi:hypothetical protein
VAERRSWHTQSKCFKALGDVLNVGAWWCVSHEIAERSLLSFLTVHKDVSRKISIMALYVLGQCQMQYNNVRSGR